MKQQRSIIGGIFFLLFPFILICICIMCFMVFAVSFATTATTNEIIEKDIQSSKNTEKIAVIDIEGTIASSQDPLGSGQKDMVDLIIAKLEKAKNDEDVKAVIIRLNTPGGTVYDSHIISEKVKEVKADKPVVALMEMSSTSGGYYVASSANKIIASETTLTGSIGVIIQVIRYDGLYEKLGLEVIQITNTNSDMKTLKDIDQVGSKDRIILEKVLNDYYESFIQTIIDGRGMPREQLLKIADGSIYSGTEALNLGLVDSLGGLNEAINVAEKEAGIEDAHIVHYASYIDPFSSFRMFVSKELNPLTKVTEKVYSEPGIYMYYLPE